MIWIIWLMWIHFYADFVLQSDEQAKGKSTSNKALTSHVLCYTFFFVVCFLSTLLLRGELTMSSFIQVMLFGGITFIAHWITDYFTSRMNKLLWESGQTHDFFVGIGFDQFLHFTQLMITCYYVF